MNTSFLLLAAGRSTRMKSDKALLEFQGKAWILHQVEQLKQLQFIDEVLIVDQADKNLDYERALTPIIDPDFSIRMVENRHPNSQPFESILLGLRQLQLKNGCFISPIDVPLDPKVLEVLWLERKTDSLALKPSFQNQGGHPVWLSEPAIEKFLAKPRRLDEFLAELSVQFIEIDNSVAVLNLNTPEEWQNFVNPPKESPSV